MRLRYSATLASLLGAPAFAAGLVVQFDIPRLDVAEYHRPYVAIWVEAADRSVASNLAVWYDLRATKDEDGGAKGLKYLKDLRQWWRRSGREMQMPIDGVSSATRPAGTYRLDFAEGKAPLRTLAPGSYTLMVEAARESGGRELLALPFQWPPAKTIDVARKGTSELAAVTLELKP